jgi:hypothetical protein
MIQTPVTNSIKPGCKKLNNIGPIGQGFEDRRYLIRRRKRIQPGDGILTWTNALAYFQSATVYLEIVL